MEIYAGMTALPEAQGAMVPAFCVEPGRGLGTAETAKPKCAADRVRHSCRRPAIVAYWLAVPGVPYR